MTNILIFSNNRPIETIGGIERATTTTAYILQSYGHRVFSIYFNWELGKLASCFTDEYKINPKNALLCIKKYINDNDINIIINQSNFPIIPLLRTAIGDSNRKLLTVHHFAPKYEESFLNIRNLFNTYKTHKNFNNFLHLLLYPFLKCRHIYLCKYYTKRGYKDSDKIILLSESYKKCFLDYIGEKNGDKIYVIPNAISPTIPKYSEKQNKNKEKIILIVSRLDENTKRISLALKIWKKAMKYKDLTEWKLIIVGEGNAKISYEKYIKKNKLYNVILVGRQTPWDYYKKASIFLMTSKAEGFGLTLIEAQYFGTVPICFDSFDASHDVIVNKKTGFIIPNNDLESYKKHLVYLMQDEELRIQMAKEGMKHIEDHYSIDYIGELWENIIKKIYDT